MGTVHIANVSGGKDSDCVLSLAMERCARRPALELIAVFADTGNEHEFVYEHIAYLEDFYGIKIVRVKQDSSAAILRRRERLPIQWTEAGVPQSFIDRALALLWPTGNAYLDLCLSKGMFAAGARRKFCTEELKIRPCDEQVIQPLLDAGRRVVQWLGIRSDESAKRAEVENHPRFQKVSTRFLLYRPILDWTVADVVARHNDIGLKMNRLYSEGFSRVGCFPCINERKGGMAIIARKFPEHIARIRAWEELVSEVAVHWRKPESFGDVATFFPAGTVPRMHRNTINDVADWAMTSRGGRQYDLLAGYVPDQKFYSCGGTGWCEAA